MRLLLDEGFPSPPGFSPESVDATIEVLTLRQFDPKLSGASTPDWYLYLRANEAGFDVLVTRDWHQAEQPEELWALTRTALSVVTWRRSTEDPIVEWGQLLAYLPEIRRTVESHGPSIVFLPAPRLDIKSIRRAAELIGHLASDLGMSSGQVRQQARDLIEAELIARDESARFADVLKSRPRRP